jgi:hypothetical protein
VADILTDNYDLPKKPMVKSIPNRQWVAPLNSALQRTGWFVVFKILSFFA